MLLISIDIEHKYKLIKKLRNYEKKIQTKIFILDDLNYNFNYANCDFVITEYNTKKIDYFLNLKKKVIICCFDNEIVNLDYKKRKNVYVCYSIKDVTKIVCKKATKKEFVLSKRNLKILMPTCIIVILALFTFVGLFRANFIKKVKVKQDSKAQKQIINNHINFDKENYVFLGDSITDFYDLEKFYVDLPVVNSGISGDQTISILDHMEERVYRYNPTKVFLLIGTNDIAYTKLTNEEIVNNIIKICNLIHKNRKNTEIYVESIYPVNKNTNNDKIDLGMVTIRENNRIKKINKLLKEKVNKNNYNYIDLYTKLCDDEGNLKLDYTKDGLHISEEGYKLITKEIKKIIYNKL